jgi:hypothetical protein
MKNEWIFKNAKLEFKYSERRNNNLAQTAAIVDWIEAEDRRNFQLSPGNLVQRLLGL